MNKTTIALLLGIVLFLSAEAGAHIYEFSCVQKISKRLIPRKEKIRLIEEHCEHPEYPQHRHIQRHTDEDYYGFLEVLEGGF